MLLQGVGLQAPWLGTQVKASRTLTAWLGIGAAAREIKAPTKPVAFGSLMKLPYQLLGHCKVGLFDGAWAPGLLENF